MSHMTTNVMIKEYAPIVHDFKKMVDEHLDTIIETVRPLNNHIEDLKLLFKKLIENALDGAKTEDLILCSFAREMFTLCKAVIGSEQMKAQVRNQLSDRGSSNRCGTPSILELKKKTHTALLVECSIHIPDEVKMVCDMLFFKTISVCLSVLNASA